VMTPSASSNHIRAIIGSPPWPSPEPQPGTRPGTGHHPCGRSAIIVSISPPGSRASRHHRCAHAPIRPAPLTRLSRPWRPTRGQRVGLQRLSGRILRHQAEEAPHSHLVTEPARFADLGKSGCPCPLRPGPGRRQRQAPTGSSPEEPRTNPVSYATLSYPTFPRPAHSQPPSVASVKDASASLARSAYGRLLDPGHRRWHQEPDGGNSGERYVAPPAKRGYNDSSRSC
jgi:hypothetical protein